MMKICNRINMNRPRKYILSLTAVLAVSSYFTKVSGLPTESSSDSWPSFPRRNLAALAKNGYIKSLRAEDFKRSISTLAKNGMLPTFRAPYEDGDQPQQHEDEAQEKRNLASVARLRSYSAMKRNVQSLARDGYRFGRGQYQPNDKRSLASLARNGMIHKKDELIGDEYYLPFYQNSVPPLSEIDGPFDFNQIYDYQQSINPDIYPPLQHLVKRTDAEYAPPTSEYFNTLDKDANWYYKRGIVGMPVHGLYRPVFIDANANGNARYKRSIFSIPDVIDRNDITIPDDFDIDNDDKRSVDEDDIVENFEKRHIGALARLGWLPSLRYSGGRYSRSGRARFLLSAEDDERKHTSDKNFGIGGYFSDTEASAFVDTNNADISPSSVSSYSHPTGRYLHRTLNDLPNDIPNTLSGFSSSKLSDPLNKNHWQQNKAVPKYYYFRSLKVPYHSSGKRYLLLPAVDNVLLRKTYNNSLPSRRKNQ